MEMFQYIYTQTVTARQPPLNTRNFLFIVFKVTYTDIHNMIYH